MSNWFGIKSLQAVGAAEAVREDACEILVRFYEPPPDLRPLFTTFYRADFIVLDGKVRDLLQPEWGGLRVFRGDRPISRVGDDVPRKRSDFVAMGPTSTSIEFELGSTRMWGIGIQPLGWAKYLSIPADEMADRISDGHRHPAFAGLRPLVERLTADPEREVEEHDMIVNFFRHELSQNPVDENRILTVHKLLFDPDIRDVASLAERAAMSQRTLERLCRRVFGFPPKLLQRRQRFMRSLARFMADPTSGWAGAMDPLYFDQSQFVRDCHRFLGMAPTEYARMEHPIMDAIMRERLQVRSSPLQTLDVPG